MSEKIVIVGAGHAGVQAAFSLRDEGFRGAITLVGDDPSLPYQRPPLSKAYLFGKIDGQGLLLKDKNLYAEYGIDRRDGTRAIGIDRQRREVLLSTGAPLAYDELILATGARERTLRAAGTTLDGVLSLRTLADADRLGAHLAKGHRVVIVGAGFIGMEFASVARALGLFVDVVDIADRPMARAASSVTSQFIRERHESADVAFHLGVGVAAFRGPGLVTHVELTDGSQLECDLALVGVGVTANAALAEEAGLPVKDGVVVDALLRTADPRISAIGDCASHPNGFSVHGRTRLECVQNATDQARTVAARIMGRATPYQSVPWFWSDQGDIKLQIAGLSTGYDHLVIRGSPEANAFSVFCFRQDRLLAVESINRGADHILARRLLAAGVKITAAQAEDPSVPLKSLMTATA